MLNPSVGIGCLALTLRVKISRTILIGLFATLAAIVLQASEKPPFNFWHCDSKAISDEEADLILVVEVVEIRRIMDPVLHHFDFGVAATVIEMRKGEYEKSAIGIHVPRQTPLEDYDPKKYGFEKGMRTTIRGKIDNEGTITIHDDRIKPR